MQLHTTIAQVSKINTEIKNLVFLNIFTHYPALPYITLYYLALPFINPALPFKFHDIFINFVRSLLTD